MWWRSQLHGRYGCTPGLLLALMVAVVGAGTASARPPPDCPSGQEPYSSNTVLLDLLIDPAARDALLRTAPQVAVPPFGERAWPTQPPTFAAIISPRTLVQLKPDVAPLLPALDAALARVPLTRAAVLARCARYDARPPRLPRGIARPAILVFDKSNGFRDGPSVDAAAAALRAMARRHGWALVSSDNGAVFNARDLARFDAVVWNNVSGDVLTQSQRASLRRWIEAGGGFTGIHGSGGDPLYLWDWYADVLIGARFSGHPMAPQFQEAAVVVEDARNPITAGLGSGWRMTEEWYSFQKSPCAHGVHVLLRLDESSYSPVGLGGADIRMGDHPIAWTSCIGNGRSFYTAIGHRPENYAEAQSLAVLENGIAWAAGLGATRCKNGREIVAP